jgi:chain length determinant protein EpsF
MTLNQVLLILRGRWRLVLGIFGAVTFIALALAFLLPKQYTAIASVVIDMKTDPLTTTAGTDEMLASYVSTQTDVIASVRVAARAVREVKLAEDPDVQDSWRSATHGGEGDINIWLADYLLDKKVVVEAAGKNKVQQGNVINISVTWHDKQMATALANAFAQSAIDTDIELKIEPAKQYAKWFDVRSRTLRADLEAKQKRLSDFQNATGIIATDEKLDVENDRLTQLSSQLIDMQGLRQDSQSRQRQTSGDSESLPEVLQSPVIGKLKDDLSAAEAKQADVAGRLGKNHPDYQAAAAEIVSLQARIAQESVRIAASLGSNTQINTRKENDVRLALEEQKKRVMDLKHQHDTAAVLQSDVTTAQRDLDAVTQRYADSALQSLTQQTNMVQLTTATEPFKASFPKKILFLLAGIFLGTVLGIGTALAVELRDPRLRDDRELVQLMGVPILATIGSMKPKSPRRWKWKVKRAAPRLEPAAI